MCMFVLYQKWSVQFLYIHVYADINHYVSVMSNHCMWVEVDAQEHCRLHDNHVCTLCDVFTDIVH